MTRVVLTEPARRDLVGAAKYIAQKANYADSATRFLEEMDKRLRVYAKQPKLAEICAELKLDCRRFTVGSYVVFYRELDDGVAVLRLVHGSRDVSAVLEEEGLE